jgi:hypothetical protein
MFSNFFALTGNTSELSVDYNPPVELPKNSQCFVGLVSFSAYNSMPNIHEDMNEFTVINEDFKDTHYISSRDDFKTTHYISTGSFELSDLERELQAAFPNENLELKANINTLTCTLLSNHPIDFTSSKSIGKLLGFDNKIYEGRIRHVAPNLININSVTALRIECSIATGSYVNGEAAHIIHESPITVDIGYEIHSVARTIIYVPLTSQNSIDNIKVRVLDQNNNLVNFRGEQVSVLLHIRSQDTSLRI